MTTEERLQEAEADLDVLIHRALCAIPTLRRAVEDVTDWRKDIRKELCENLEKATNKAHENQSKRRRSPCPINAPLKPRDADVVEDFIHRGHRAQLAVDEILAHEAAKPENEGKDELDQTSKPQD